VRLAQRLWQTPVLVNSFTHILRVLGGPFSVLLIARHLSLESQGIYYSILNLVILQIWAEAGLTHILITFSSHESPQLEWTPSGLPRAPQENLRRLSQLLKVALYYFAIASPILGLGLAGVGMLAFGRLEAGQRLAVGTVWLGAIFPICLRFMMTGLWSVFEGCGRMLWVYRMRMLDTVLSLLTLWLGLYFGLGIYALPLSYWTGYCVQLGAMVRVRASILELLRCSPKGIDWGMVGEIWPLQWRLALAAMAGVIGSQFSSLMVYFHSASEAGRLGMTWSLLAGGCALCGILITARNPHQCVLVARGERQLARNYFRKTLIGVIGLSCAGVAAATVLVWCVREFQPRWAVRILDVPTTGILGVGLVLNWFTTAQCTWVRAHKQEPFLAMSLITAAGIFLGIAWLAPTLGSYGLALAYTGSLAVLTLPVTTYFSERLLLKPAAEGFVEVSPKQCPGES
jgi:hypothetical protein